VIDKNYISPLEEGGGKRTNMIYKDPLQKKGGFWFFSVCVIRKKGYGGAKSILYLNSHPLPPDCFLLQFHSLFYILRYFFKIPSDFYENGQKINYICLPPSPYFY
jgi:hypothetical protein